MRLQISLSRDAAVKMILVAIDAARAEKMLPLTVVVLGTPCVCYFPFDDASGSQVATRYK